MNYIYTDKDEMIESWCLVSFNYTPAQLCGSKRGQEGFPASVELENVLLNDDYDFIDELSDYDRERLEEIALGMMK